jgi:hypothetical protein
MRTLSADTDPGAEAVMIEGLRRMTPGQRLRRAFDLCATAIALARTGLRRRHGDLPEREMRLRLAALWLDAPTMRRVYGWDPTARGS